MRLPGQNVREIREEIRLVIPPRLPVVEVLRDTRIARKILDPDPYLPERELPRAGFVEPPPIRVADPVEAREIGFHEIRVILEESEEGR